MLRVNIISGIVFVSRSNTCVNSKVPYDAILSTSVNDRLYESYNVLSFVSRNLALVI